MKPILFTTESVRAAEQAHAWSDWFHPIFDISHGQPDVVAFCAQNKVWDMGGILLSAALAPATRVTRGKLNISRAPADHWVISYNRRGDTAIATDRATLHASAGVPFLWSLGEKSSSERSSVDRLQLLIPRDMFRDMAPTLDASRGSVLDTALGRMLGDYMLFLEKRLDTIAGEDLPRLRDAVRSMIAACVAPSADRLTVAADEIDSGRRERVCRIIHAHLGSPSLTPTSITKLVGISRTQLYRLFEQSGGVLSYIRRQRLLQSYATLSDPECKQSILTIADSLCFEDASSFSRAFKKEFGHTPSDVKAAAVVGLDLTTKVKFPAAEAQRFGDLLGTGSHGPFRFSS